MPVGFQDRPSCCLAAPDEDENTYLNPSLRGAQRRGNLYHPLSHSEESGVFAGRRKNLII